MGCNGVAWIYGQLAGELICHGYMCILLYMKLMWCNGFPEIYAQLEGVQLRQVYLHATICKTTLV